MTTYQKRKKKYKDKNLLYKLQEFLTIIHICSKKTMKHLCILAFCIVAGKYLKTILIVLSFIKILTIYSLCCHYP